MIRRLLLSSSLAIAGLAATITPTAFAPAAFAQTAAAKSVVDAAKAQGVVGEQGDGYLGFVTGSGASSVKSAVDEINAGRAKAYHDIAAKTGVSDAAAGEATALQLFAKLPPGTYYRPLGGSWTRK
jgi:uncharacterized protein YdbL (DUF1318 family)